MNNLFYVRYNKIINIIENVKIMHLNYFESINYCIFISFIFIKTASLHKTQFYQLQLFYYYLFVYFCEGLLKLCVY